MNVKMKKKKKKNERTMILYKINCQALLSENLGTDYLALSISELNQKNIRRKDVHVN